MKGLTSYAQNREDVLLHRALDDCPHRNYVDVGAGHPVLHSVTKHFYDQGWTGVNIEPRPDMHDRLCFDRPRDRNLRIGVADRPGQFELNVVSVPGLGSAEGEGLSTFDTRLADNHIVLGRTVHKIETPIWTLSQVFEEHVSGTVSFLKVDVEGFEHQVLRGLDWTRWRPRVVLVEAIDAVTQEPNHEFWEPVLVEAGYLFAHGDGLNRFYVRREDESLLRRFERPVSVLDNFTPYESLCLRKQNTRLREEVANMRRRLAVSRKGTGRRDCPDPGAGGPVDVSGDSLTDVPVSRVLLDATSTCAADMHTGIQRVVRNLARFSAAQGEEFGWECLPVRLYGQDFVPASLEPDKTGPAGRAWDLTCRAYRASAATLCRVLPVPGLRRQLLPPPGRRGIFKIPWTIHRKLKDLAVRGSILSLRSDDLLVLLDASWGVPVWPAVQAARAAGARVAVVAYDLIPVSHPQFCTPAHRQAFEYWLDNAAQFADYFVTISPTVADHLQDYLDSRHPRGDRPHCVTSFPLGATLDKASHQPKVRRETRRVFESADPTFLMVGTIEPRKNHVFLLEAFERVWDARPDARLCAVGRIGWLCDDIVQRFRTHPRYGKTLFLLTDANDSELAYCYDHARALTYSSITEGYGLPLVEALQHGLPVIASDTPIHREVCGEFAAYFPLDDARPLAELVLRAAESPSRLPARPPSEFEPPTWEASSREFLRAHARCLSILNDDDLLASDADLRGSRSAA